MMDAEAIMALWDAFEAIIDPLQIWLVTDIARRIAEAGDITRTAKNEAALAAKLGTSWQAAQAYIMADRKRQDKQLALIFQKAAALSWATATGVEAIQNNEAIQRIVSASVALAGKDLDNITRTIGFIDPRGYYQPINRIYRECSDYALTKAASGATTYQQATVEAVQNIAQYGAQVIDYESGQRASLDVAVRRNVFGGMGLMAEQLQNEAHKEIGANGWEISAHEACAKDHEDIQGRQFTDAEFLKLNGTAEQAGTLKRRIGTLNCKHIAFPIILGVQEPMYTDEQLKAMKDRNEAGVTVDGRHYTTYEATQQQRAIERAIRRQKRKVAAIDAAGGDVKPAKTRLNVLLDRYDAFSKAAGLRTQYQRLDAMGL